MTKIGFLNPNESENRFCVSWLDRSIEDLSDHVRQSKGPKNPQTYPDLLSMFSKETQIPFSDSFGFKIHSWIFLKKRKNAWWFSKIKVDYYI